MIALNNSSSSHVTASSLTYALTANGTNRLVVVAAHDFSGNGVTGVTYAGSAMTQLETTQNNGAGQFVSVWYLISPTSGANNVVVSASASHILYSEAASYTGVAQTSPIDVSGVATFTSTGTHSISLTTTVLDTWLIGGFMAPSGTYTATSGVIRTSDSGNIQIQDSNSNQSVGSHSLSCTLSPNNTGAIVAGAFKPALGISPSSSASPSLSPSSSISASLSPSSSISPSSSASASLSPSSSVSPSSSASRSLSPSSSISASQSPSSSSSASLSPSSSTSQSLSPSSSSSLSLSPSSSISPSSSSSRSLSPSSSTSPSSSISPSASASSSPSPAFTPLSTNISVINESYSISITKPKPTELAIID